MLRLFHKTDDLTPYDDLLADEEFWKDFQQLLNERLSEKFLPIFLAGSMAAARLRAKHPAAKEFDPNQPRDEHGRWTSEGGGGGEGEGSADTGGASGFEKDFEKVGYPNPLRPRETIYGNAGVVLSTQVSMVRGQHVTGVYIDELRSIKAGSNDAIRLMSKITELADKNNVSLYLLAHPFEGARGVKPLSTKKLVRFYKHFGFKETYPGENNYGEGTPMHRDPVGAKSSASGRDWPGAPTIRFVNRAPEYPKWLQEVVDECLLDPEAVEKEFDPDQPRDERGQWTDSGGGGGSEGVRPGGGMRDAVGPVSERMQANAEKWLKEEGVTREALAANLQSTLDAATPLERAEGTVWYDRAHETAAELGERYGVSTEQAAGVLAALSPRTDWDDVNKPAADRLLAVVKEKTYTLTERDIEKRYAASVAIAERSGAERETMLRRAEEVRSLSREWVGSRPTEEVPSHILAMTKPVGVLADNAEKGIRIARGEDPVKVLSENPDKGFKVRSFYSNIADPKGSREVTIDTHMVNAAMGKIVGERGAAPVFSARAKYATVRDALRSITPKGMSFKQVQAIIWTHQMRLATAGKTLDLDEMDDVEYANWLMFDLIWQGFSDLEAAQIVLLATKEWNEEDHPRDEGGRFTFADGGGGGGGGDGAQTEHAVGVLRSNHGRQVEIGKSELAPLMREIRNGGIVQNLSNVAVKGEPNLYTKHLTERTRAEMPQLPVTVDGLKEFTSYMEKEGIGYKVEEVDPRSLVASQKELNSLKVAQMVEAMEKGEMREGSALVVSREGAILDGHHRWAAEAARAALKGGGTVKVVRYDTDIEHLLELAGKFEGVTHEGLLETVAKVIRELLQGEKSGPREPTSPPPSVDEPWVWLDGEWIHIYTDADMPRKIQFDEPVPLEEKEFDPNQPRDEQGRWTSDGGAGDTYADRLARAESVDERISVTTGNGGILRVSRIPKRDTSLLVTEDGRFISGGAMSHDAIADEMGYHGEQGAIEAGLSRASISHFDYPDPHLQIAIESRDLGHVRSTARAIQHSFNEDERASAQYFWQVSRFGNGGDFGGSGSYRELLAAPPRNVVGAGMKTRVNWPERIREFFKEFDENQPRDERGQWTDNGGGVATAEPSLDERIAESRWSVSPASSEMALTGTLGFMTEDGRYVWADSEEPEVNHRVMANSLGFESHLVEGWRQSETVSAIESGLTRVQFDRNADGALEASIEARDAERLRAAAREINHRVDPDERAGVIYYWEVLHSSVYSQGGNSGMGSYHDVQQAKGEKTLDWYLHYAFLTTAERFKGIVEREWNEEDHPRDEGGRFTDSGGGAEASTKLAPALERAERNIRNNPVEAAIALDKDGKILFETSGEYESVTFTEGELARLNGATVTHNHPLEYSLSRADVETACKYKVAEIRAVTPKGKTYSIKPKDGKWKSELEFSIRLTAAATQQEAQDRRLMMAGKLTIDEANLRYHDKLWRENADYLGIVYRVTGK